MALAEALMELEGLQFPEIEASAVERLRQFVQTRGGLPIERDCQSREIVAVGDDDMRETVLPLCRWVIGLTRHLEGGRVLVGVSGSAGAGKSTLAQLLCAACNTLLGRSHFSQTVSMDAYSYPNEHLSAQPAEDHLGRACTLKDTKGQPKTLDCASLLRDLERLRLPNAQSLLLPAYSRQLHDPVPGCVAVWPDCNLVMVEGLHLLHQKGLWKDVFAALHRTVFLDIERLCCFERVVGRKIANGRSRESSEAHFDRVDGPIWDQLQEEKSLANLVLAVRPTRDRHLNVSDIITRKPCDKPSSSPVAVP